jgi:hypothetical protein
MSDDRYLWRGYVCRACGHRIVEADGMFEWGTQQPDGTVVWEGMYCATCNERRNQ